ncbi:MAG TPA: NAD(P)-binding domain-containing protein [Gemmatimonadaceae bacterium]|nr:NAD(P)-binding domain-containing protein [Gemmatimonadaceae bacterium]
MIDALRAIEDLNMTIVTIVFVAMTVLSIWLHVRRERKAEQRAARPPHRCRRCRAQVPADAATCPRCGVPQQAFELLSAPIAAPASASNDNAPLRAHVRNDVCVGCGACASACPEDGALTMRGKLAVIDPDKCKGHGDCAKACPVGAIAMARGAAVNRVVVPALDQNFQTNIPGLYIVGELGGRGLIKNAVNEGKIAIEHVHAMRQKAVARGALHHDAADDVLDIIIVGGGPAGLSAGLQAVRAGLRYAVIEQGTVADSVRKYPRHKLLLAEPVSIPLYGDLWVADASKEALLQVWESAVKRAGLRVITSQRVENVERAGDTFVVRVVGGAAYRGGCVVLAMGRRGTPRRLGVPGEESSRVVYDIAEMSDFAGRRVLVVGGGDSAIESVIGLANQKGTTVTLSYRGESFDRVKPRNLEKLKAAQASGRVAVVLRSQVREIRDDVVVLDVGGQARILPVDDVVVRIGGNPPQGLLDKIGIRMVEKELGLPAAEALGA